MAKKIAVTALGAALLAAIMAGMSDALLSFLLLVSLISGAIASYITGEADDGVIAASSMFCGAVAILLFLALIL